MAAPSMTRLFMTCQTILYRAMTPLHYEDLTKQALEMLGCPTTGETLRLSKEDVREKMAMAGQRGTFYVGKPHCLVCLSDWFPSEQIDLFDHSHLLYKIDGSAYCGQEAATECLLRAPHMQTKVSASEARWEGLARGMVIEKHVVSWFRSRWPAFYLRPDNDGKWDQWCDHDFKIILPTSRPLKVDVMGPLLAGGFGKPYGNGKREVDIHLCASIFDGHIRVHGWRGFTDGLPQRFDRNDMRPIQWLIVWLNCEANGMDYRDLRDRAP